MLSENFRLRNYLIFIFLYIVISFSFSDNISKGKISLSAYSFGSLGELAPREQIRLLHQFGYKGIILNSERRDDSLNIDVFIAEASNYKQFKVQSVMARYNFSDPLKENWKVIVDKIANKGIELWVIFGAGTSGITDSLVETKLREMVEYSKKRNVTVILYPHSSCYIASAEEALPFVERINDPNLKLAVHLCHEIRAGNGARIDKVFERVKSRIGAVTLAGTDSVPDRTSDLNFDLSTIKPIGKGNYNLTMFVKSLKISGYGGMVGFINFKIDEDPKIYLPTSFRYWESCLKK